MNSAFVVDPCRPPMGYEDNRNVARMAVLLAGLPVEIPGPTVNRLCGSGMEAASPGSARTSGRAPDVSAETR